MIHVLCHWQLLEEILYTRHPETINCEKKDINDLLSVIKILEQIVMVTK